jgi:hypothetical protein
MRADSNQTAKQSVSRVFALREPTVPLDYSVDGWNKGPLFDDIWESTVTQTPLHWLEFHFAAASSIGAVTIVPMNYLAPFEYDAVGRPKSLEILGAATLSSQWRELWSVNNLQDRPIVLARFAPQTLRKIKFVFTADWDGPAWESIARDQRLPGSRQVGIAYIRFPGYRINVKPGS